MLKSEKENCWFPLSPTEIKAIKDGFPVRKHYHLPQRGIATLMVDVATYKRKPVEYETFRARGISVTSIALSDSDIATIEKGDTVCAEYTEGFRIIMLSAATMKQSKTKKKEKSRWVTYPNPSADDIERIRKILKETSHQEGLKAMNEVEEFAKTVISLIEQGKGFSPRLISNEQIFREITSLTRFSRKRWEKLKPLIKAVNGFKIGTKGLFGYAPMLRSHYNVKATDAPSDYRYIAGFQLVIRDAIKRERETA